MNRTQNRFIIAILFPILFGLPYGCKSGVSAKHSSVIPGPADLLMEEPPLIKDRVDSLIEGRSSEMYNSTIFAGLRFGDSKIRVTQVLKEQLPVTIQIPNGDNVETVIVDDYDATFFNERLAVLVLYAKQSSLHGILSKWFSTKYGDTKKDTWNFSNCTISVEIKSRVPHLNYDGTVTMYYNSYRNDERYYLTKDCCFLKITYQDHGLLHLLERQKVEKDSLENAKRIQEVQAKKQAERDLAKKLSEEGATNI